ncbi:MAG: NAD(P)H-dependent oxidoreductase, partial [Lachnospiraceae bacterium]|nr:NAD(P)H-dependent oxidoreductase [Lachnospiraceae bacterium]
MKVLVINGSPKGKKSNSYRLTEAFINGMRQAADQTVGKAANEEV